MYKLFLILAAVVFMAGCEECERATNTVTNLTTAEGWLTKAIDTPDLFPTTCDVLVRHADQFRIDADYYRNLATLEYTGTVGTCMPGGWITVCEGGWGRYPYYLSSRPSPGRVGGGVSRPAPSRPSPSYPSPSRPSPSYPTPSRPSPSRPNPSYPSPSRPSPSRPNPIPPGNYRPRPAPAPRAPLPFPRPLPPAPARPYYPPYYPPQFPRHYDWYWGYNSPYNCRLVCLQFSESQYARPGYDQIMAIASELDQASAGIETACAKVYDKAPLDEILVIAREARDGIETRALPLSRAAYNGMGCTANGD